MSEKNDIDTLAALLEEANKQAIAAGTPDTFGKCEWVDLNGNARCNSPWSKFQCQQAAGTWYEGESC